MPRAPRGAKRGARSAGRTGRGGFSVRRLAMVLALAVLLAGGSLAARTLVRAPGSVNGANADRVQTVHAGSPSPPLFVPLADTAAAASSHAPLPMAGTGTSPASSALLAQSLQQPFLSGVVEGFYGTPWSLSATQAVLGVMQQAGMNAFVYAPKADPYARSKWNVLYPSSNLSQLSGMVQAAQSRHITFVYSLSPGLSIVYSNPTDRAELLAKIQQIEGIGVHTFMLSFDDTPATLSSPADIAAYPNGLGEAQSSLTNWLLGKLGPSHVRLLFTPTEYYGLTNGPYWEALHQYLAPGIDVLWTGPNVLSSSITSTEAETFAHDVGHPVMVWDNYPVNDYTYQIQHAPRLFLGPLRNRGTTLPSVLSGYFANPMIQPLASEVALLTVGAYLAHPGTYNPAVSWSSAVTEVGVGAESSFRLLAEDASSSFLTGGQSMSPLPPAMAAYWNTPSSTTTTALQAQFTAMAGASSALSSLSMPGLYGEIKPWAAELSAEGQDGLDALTLLADAQNGSSTSQALSTVEADITALKSPPVVLDTTAPVLNFLEQAVNTGG